MSALNRTPKTSALANILILVTSLLMSISSYGAPTKLADEPLADQTSDKVKPNILFTLDDSGSMNWEYMPDDLQNRTDSVGLRNHMCNLVYYNPNTVYTTPVDSAGSPINASTTLSPGNGTPTAFTAAYNQGFYKYITSGDTSTTNLSTSFRALIADGIWTNMSDTAQAAYRWQYLGSATLVPLDTNCNAALLTEQRTSSNSGSTWSPWGAVSSCVEDNIGTNRTECRSDTTSTGICLNGSTYSLVTNSPPTCATGTLVWKKIVVSATSGPSGTNEQQNFANWYSYYRKRLLMMKSASGRAFSTVTDAYRMGFITINPNDPVTTDKFLAVSDFNTTQKASWFSNLYSQTTNGGTPLRTALSRAGRYFAHKTNGINDGMSTDPVQYSCQQNFSILTTDGYWNGSGGLKLDGTTDMDNQDGIFPELDAYNPTSPDDKRFRVSPYPMYDGAIAYYVWNTATNAYQYLSGCTTTATQTKTRQWQSRTVTATQQRTSTLQTRTATLQQSTSTNSGSSWSAWATATPTCTWDNNSSSRTRCQYLVWSSWSNTGSCTPAQGTSTTHGTGWPGPAVGCQYTAWTAWSNVASCTAVAQSTSGTLTVATARECQPVYSAWANTTGTCTPSATVQCQSIDGAWTNVASCTPSGPDANGQEILCQSAGTSGKKIQYKTKRTSVTYPGPNQMGTGVPTSPPDITDANWSDYDGICHPVGLEPAFPATTVTGVGPPAPPGTCTSGSQVWPCETYSASGGSSNSLADVAQYYYKTDLRTATLGNCTGTPIPVPPATTGGSGQDVCSNNVKQSGKGDEDDKASWQHMTTFTMGLGLSGTLNFDPGYKAVNSTGDFAAIRAGNKMWPIPSANDPSALDDLWHAAVNGRGQYLSAGDPDKVVDGLNTALLSINASTGAAAAAATSSLEPVSGDNYAYTAEYKTSEWTGQLKAHRIDLGTGTVEDTDIWSAQGKLDAITQSACDTRNIKLFRAGATDNLVDFKWGTDTCNSSNQPSGILLTTLNATEQAYFDSGEVALLYQFASMTSTQFTAAATQRTAAAGANLVNYLRGQRSKEGFVANDVDQLYRTRTHILGDIVNAQPVYVKAPFSEYADTGYTAFKAANTASVAPPVVGRTPMVYAAANDGMLHAFYAGTSDTDPNGGKEAWAFIPTMVLPNLYKLANTNYGDDGQHVFSVDGTPSVGDVYDTTASTWKTILVAGLNKGGKGYYALDITDPASPKALWEFKYSTTCYNNTPATAGADCHLGYTFSNPIISKLTDGRWVVFVTSGYNNVSSPSVSGDGQGYLYVLDAITGKILYKIATSAGSATTPSGLNHISAWVDDSLHDNTTDRLYGVDLLGNIWRFDVNDNFGTLGREATLLATVVDSAGNGQPITTRPELAEYQAQPYVYVGTGRYLDKTDSTDFQDQSIWAIKDPMTTTAVTSLRSTLKHIVITTLGDGTSATRTAACSSACTSTSGWFVDLPVDGERVNIDMKLQLGTLIVASNIPTPSDCDVGGKSWINYFDYATGLAVSNSYGVVGARLFGEKESLAVGLNIVRLPNNKVVVIVTTSAAEHLTVNAPFSVPPPSGKRISWREVNQ